MCGGAPSKPLPTPLPTPPAPQAAGLNYQLNRLFGDLRQRLFGTTDEVGVLVEEVARPADGARWRGHRRVPVPLNTS